MKVKQISQWLHKNSKIKYLIRLLIIAAVAWVLRFWEFEERRNRNYYEYDIMSAREPQGACSLLANGELDHDSCEATVSTEGANHDIICKDKWKCTRVVSHRYIISEVKKYMEILELDLYAESAYYGKVQKVGVVHLQ